MKRVSPLKWRACIKYTYALSRIEGSSQGGMSVLKFDPLKLLILIISLIVLFFGIRYVFNSGILAGLSNGSKQLFQSIGEKMGKSLMH